MRFLVDNALSPEVAVEADLLAGAIVVVEPVRLRVRSLPISGRS